MGDSIRTDFSQIDKLTADLGTVAKDAGPNVAKAVEVTLRHVKDDWQKPLKGSSTLPALPFSLSYELGGNQSLLRDVLTGTPGLANTIYGEVGFDKDKNQGPLGNISEFGSPTITGRGFGLAALEKNQGDFVKGLEIATAAVERKAGL